MTSAPDVAGGAVAAFVASAAEPDIRWPTTREESWRYFPTRALHAYALASPMQPVETAATHDGDHARVVLVNGHVVDLVNVPAGVTIGPLIEPDASHEDGLAAANRAYGAAIGITLARDVVVPLLEVVHHAQGDGVAHPRLVIELASHAELSLVQRFVGDGAYFVNAVTRATLAAGARLQHVKLESEDARASHVDAVTVEVGRDAHYHGFVVSLGATRARTAPSVRLAAPGASCQVDGLYLGLGDQLLDHTAVILHAAPKTSSHATWAGVLDGKATGTFQGLISMMREAPGSKTRELTRTLLLSPTANANAKPELRIDIDDVEASHGASVGSLDPAQLFYLEARGIAPDEARRMLVGAFVATTVALAPERLRPFVHAALGDRVSRAYVPGDDHADL